ncbi:MAG TPA: hypothetical protein VGY48_15450 [Vicinamibacterales bacterium]|jgi:hypothetical protein|nr:hypothetical protein [Vicinamibacterales bacterium]
MSSKITVVTGFVDDLRITQARFKPYGDLENEKLLYWKSRRWNGHVRLEDEGTTWIRGWNITAVQRRALLSAYALSR